MSINAIGSVSLYEYYYQINNNNDSRSKKSSSIEKQMREYGLTPTEDDELNAALLKKAQSEKQTQDSEEEIPYTDRPWADLMYQLNLSFNPDPKDDIEDIKEELQKLTFGMNDEELQGEITDLEDYVEELYIDFQKNYSSNTINPYSAFDAQLKNLSVINRANLL